MLFFSSFFFSGQMAFSRPEELQRMTVFQQAGRQGAKSRMPSIWYSLFKIQTMALQEAAAAHGSPHALYRGMAPMKGPVKL